MPGKRSPAVFEARSRETAEAMLEGGDGRVTRASLLSAHEPEADNSELECGVPEISSTFVGCAEHHGMYSEPSLQSQLLRLLLRPPRSPVGPAPPPGRPPTP
jgi:hypothetical protein